jgi:hypothetical protein
MDKARSPLKKMFSRDRASSFKKTDEAMYKIRESPSADLSAPASPSSPSIYRPGGWQQQHASPSQPAPVKAFDRLYHPPKDWKVYHTEWKPVAAGNFGQVFKVFPDGPDSPCKPKAIGTPCAVKLVVPKPRSGIGCPDALAEAAVQRQMGEAGHTLRVYSVAVDGNFINPTCKKYTDVVWILMDWADFTTEDAFYPAKGLPENVMFYLTSQLFSDLQHMHRVLKKGHQDIKPDNVLGVLPRGPNPADVDLLMRQCKDLAWRDGCKKLLDRCSAGRCEFYLADYGLARDIAAGADLVQGSPPFLPPEAIPVALGMDMAEHDALWGLDDSALNTVAGYVGDAMARLGRNVFGDFASALHSDDANRTRKEQQANFEGMMKRSVVAQDAWGLGITLYEMYWTHHAWDDKFIRLFARYTGMRGGANLTAVERVKAMWPEGLKTKGQDWSVEGWGYFLEVLGGLLSPLPFERMMALEPAGSGEHFGGVTGIVARSLRAWGTHLGLHPFPRQEERI